MSQPAILEIGEGRATRAARFALLLGAAILVWLALAGVAIFAFDGRDAFDDSPAAPSPTPAGEIVQDPDGQLCARARLTSDGFCILP